VGKLDAKNRRVPPSEPGSALPMLYGAYPISGALVDARPEYREEKQKRGKIGGKTIEYTYYGDFYYILGESLPGARLLKLKLNGEKVIDLTSSNTDELIKSQDFLNRYIRFYDGNESQLPDPTLQQIWGVDNTPSYRGFMAIAIHDLPLTDYGNRPVTLEAYISESSWYWTGTVTTLRETPASIGTVPPDDYLLGRYSVQNVVGTGVGTLAIPIRGKLLAILDAAYLGNVGLIVPPAQGATPPHPWRLTVQRQAGQLSSLTVSPTPGNPAYQTFFNADWANGCAIEFRILDQKIEIYVNGVLTYTQNTPGVECRVQSILTAGSVQMQIITESQPKSITRALPQVVPLQAVVNKLLTGVLADTSELSNRNVRGGLLDQSNARDRLAELQKTYFFDLIETDGTLKALSPNRSGVAADLPIDQMGASETGDAPLFELEKINQTELPYEVELTYWQESRDDVNSVYARAGRFNPKYNQIQLAANLWEKEAQAMANLALRLVQLRSQSIKFATTIDYLHTLPGDVVQLSPYGQKGKYQITDQTLGANLVLEQTALPYDDAAWDLLPTISNPPQQGLNKSTIPEPKVVIFRASQALRPSDILPCLYMGVASGGNWSTAAFFISINNGQSYYYAGETRSIATLGLLNATLTAAGTSAIVRLQDGQINGLTTDEWTYSTSLNRAVIGTRTTQEVIQFRNAQLLGTKTYKIDTFRRGQLGTAAIAHPANDWFVFVNNALITVPLDAATVGATILVKVLLDNEPDAPAIPYLVP
jgi:hypothetical protein